MPAKDKHSSLLRKFANYGRKKFYNIGHQGFQVLRLDDDDPLFVGDAESGKGERVVEVGRPVDLLKK